MYVVEYMIGAQRFKEEMLGSEAEIRQRLAHSGKVVLSVSQPRLVLTRKIKDKEIVAAFTALGDLLNSGVTPSRAFPPVILSLDKSSHLPAVLSKVSDAVGEGRHLSEALSHYPQFFAPPIIAMVEAGENSGRLAAALLSVADYVRSMGELRKEMMKKLIYPASVFGVATAALVVNTTVIIPKVLNSELFKMTQSAPGGGGGDGAIQALKALTVIIPSTVGVGLVAGAFMFALYRRDQVRAEHILGKIPLVREFLFCRSWFVVFSALANLLSVGVRRDIALAIVAQSTKFYTVRKQLEEARQLVKDGLGFAKALRSLEPIERTMLEAAQNDDRIEQNFRIISQRFYQLYMERVKSVGPRLYAVVMVMVAALFLLMVFGILLPYMKVIGGVHA